MDETYRLWSWLYMYVDVYVCCMLYEDSLIESTDLYVLAFFHEPFYNIGIAWLLKRRTIKIIQCQMS